MEYEKVLTSAHFMSGNMACAEGAIVAGCRFFAGYPITSATEIVEHTAARMPKVGGAFAAITELVNKRLLRSP
jgi:2-oxoglutarate ferredoxin oxidoreductase subunit alpha